MKVSKKMFANYLGIHPTNIGPYYESYLQDLGLNRKYLLVSDIARADCVTIKYVCEIIGIKVSCDCNFIPNKNKG